MSDNLFHWHINDSWTYAHGVHGPNCGDPTLSSLETGTPWGLAGLNQLYGDGHVVWESGRSMNKTALSPNNPAAGFVRAFSTDTTFY